MGLPEDVLGGVRLELDGPFGLAAVALSLEQSQLRRMRGHPHQRHTW